VKKPQPEVDPALLRACSYSKNQRCPSDDFDEGRTTCRTHTNRRQASAKAAKEGSQSQGGAEGSCPKEANEPSELGRLPTFGVGFTHEHVRQSPFGQEREAACASKLAMLRVQAIVDDVLVERKKPQIHMQDQPSCKEMHQRWGQGANCTIPASQAAHLPQCLKLPSSAFTKVINRASTNQTKLSFSKAGLGFAKHTTPIPDGTVPKSKQDFR
jgi:hypothetical protein